MLNRRNGVSTVEYVVFLAGIVVALVVALPYLAEGENKVFAKLQTQLGSQAESPETAKTKLPSTDEPKLAQVSSDRMFYTLVVFLVGSSVSVLLYIRQKVHEKSELKKAMKRQYKHKPKDKEVIRRRMEEKRNSLNRVLQNQWSSVVKAEIQVGDLMSTKLITIGPDEPVDAIESKLRAEQLHHVLVVNAEGTFLGIISDRDIQRRPGNVAAEVMTAEPLSVRPDTDIKQAITIILIHGFSALPVVDDGKLVGIITTNDLVATLHCTLVQLMELAYLLKTEEGRELLAKSL